MRLFPWLTAACFGLATLASARSGYLAVVGPSPLRFQQPRPPPLAQLPPLPKEQPAPAVSAPPERVSPPDVTVVSQWVAPVVAGAATTDTNEAAVTPGMLVETFRQRVRGDQPRETAVVLPLGFVPPAPPAKKPSSTATYESP
jgi:hypothetical protein